MGQELYTPLLTRLEELFENRESKSMVKSILDQFMYRAEEILSTLNTGDRKCVNFRDLFED